MRSQFAARAALMFGVLVLAAAVAVAADKPGKPAKKKAPPSPAAVAHNEAVKKTMEKTAVDQAAVDKAFDALKTYDWGQSCDVVRPIDDAVVAVYGDAAAAKALETRLAAVLKTEVPQPAKGYVCRKLTVIGTAESVPALAELLANKDFSHMARYALQQINAAEAGQALRDALPKLAGDLRIGVIASLGARREAASVAALAALLADADAKTAAAAAHALGTIGSADAAKALGDFAPKAPEAVKPAVADALLVSAENLAAEGKKAEALAVYKLLAGEEQPKHVRLAAMRGRLGLMGKKD